MIATQITKCSSYQDSDITFCLMVYKDYRDARKAIASIRRSFPRSPVIVISDGDSDPRHVALAERYQCRYILGKRLFLTEYGGQLKHRYLSLFLEQPTKWLVKIDPDTRVHRRFNYLLDGRAIYGTLLYHEPNARPKHFPIVQGGATCYPRAVCQEIIDSGILLSDELLDYRRTYAEFPQTVRRAEAESEGLVSDDNMNRYLCRQLNIPVCSFPEVYSTWGGPIRNPNCRYALTHPHKSSWVVLNRQFKQPHLVPHSLLALLKRSCKPGRVLGRRLPDQALPSSEHENDHIELIWPNSGERASP